MSPPASTYSRDAKLVGSRFFLASEASNVTQRNRVVVNPHHDDGDCACCSLHGTRRGFCGRNDHIHLETDQFGSETGKLIDPLLGGPELDGDVLTFDIAQLAQFSL